MEGFSTNSFAQDVEYIFQLGDHLLDELLVLGGVVLGFVAGQAQACATDGKALVYSNARIWRIISTSWRW